MKDKQSHQRVDNKQPNQKVDDKQARKKRADDEQFQKRVDDNMKMPGWTRLKIKRDDCRKCAYRGSITSCTNPKGDTNLTCDYISFTGKARSLICSPGECREKGVFRSRRRGRKKITGCGEIRHDFTEGEETDGRGQTGKDQAQQG